MSINRIHSNLPDAKNTLAMGLADTAPPPYNAIGMSLVALIWPSSSPLPATMESIIQEIEIGLINQSLDAAESTATGIQSYLDIHYGTGVISSHDTYTERLAQLEKFNKDFFLNIISVVKTIEANTAVNAEAECKTLIPLITWAGWHLALLQEMALMDVKNAPNPQDSQYITTANALALDYVTQINTLHNKYFIPPDNTNSSRKECTFTCNGKKITTSGQNGTVYNRIGGFTYATYMTPQELQKKAQGEYNDELKKQNFWVLKTGTSDPAGPLVPKIISSFNKIAADPLPTSAYGLKRFLCFTGRSNLNEANKLPLAGQSVEIYYYGEEGANPAAPAKFNQTPNLNYTDASFWAWKGRPEPGTIPIYRLLCGEAYFFSPVKTWPGFVYRGLAFYAYPNLQKAQDNNIETVPLLLSGYTPANFWQLYFFTTKTEGVPPNFNTPTPYRPNSQFPGNIHVGVGDDL